MRCQPWKMAKVRVMSRDIRFLKIGFCLQWLNRSNKEGKISALSRKIAHRILDSGLWQSILEKDKLHPKNLGLYDGIAGVGYSILYSMDPAVKIT